ncbi:MAG: DNA repair protein RadC, partial [Bacilli bacterium]|nr:DNA repair protein RadC [Bacilli bacterium]
MSYLIKEMPVEERPRERFKRFGVKALSNEELLSILIRTGSNSKSVKDLSDDVLKSIDIHDMANVSYNTLKSIKGIGEVKAITIQAAIEFGKRVLNKADLVQRIKSGNDAYYLLRYEMENELQEKFMAIYLDTKNNVIMKKVIFVGTVNSSGVTARDVFREGVKNNATSMIIAHNHPAGSVIPSKDDIYLTKEFVKLGRMMGINVIDHLIIGKNRY